MGMSAGILLSNLVSNYASGALFLMQDKADRFHEILRKKACKSKWRTEQISVGKTARHLKSNQEVIQHPNLMTKRSSFEEENVLSVITRAS